MAFTNGLSERMGELRYGGQRSSADESTFTGFATSRPQSSFFSSFQPPSNDSRGSLQRRFTTDASKMSTASPFSQQYQPGPGTLSQHHLVESIREQKRLAEAQLKMLELQEQSLRQGGTARDLEHISRQVKRISLNGPVSEPTTPPEYAENSYSSRYSRSSRYSTNNVVSPPGFSARYSQSSTQITSPPPGDVATNGTQSQKPPAKSMPGSRRGSDEDEFYPEELPVTRSAASLNRYSMPVNGNRNRTRSSMGAAAGRGSGLGPLNTTSFLFDENEQEDKHLSLNAIDLSSPVAKAYAQLGGDDTFPTLRSDGFSGRLSANSAALDLANSTDPEPDIWTLGTRYRPSHQSMPHTDSSMYRPVLSNLSSPPSERTPEVPGKKSLRHSTNVTFDDSTKFEAVPTTASLPRPGSLQTSYSMSDVPTLRNSTGYDTVITPPKTAAEQQFHNHNVNMGRIPANGINSRQSRDLSSALGNLSVRDDSSSGPPSLSSLQASAAPFGPSVSVPTDNSLMNIGSPTMSFNAPQAYAYSMQTYNANQINSQMVGTNPLAAYTNQHQTMFGPMSSYAQFAKTQDAQVRRRAGPYGGDESRFNNMPLETYRGSLYELCKDQHGCRYLQRRLEEGNPEHIEAIFLEIRPHIIELMTDPFGNYLCQKLLEHCNDDQRTILISSAAPALSVIALNQHGTRALQKMIEFVHTDEQIQTIVQALSEQVVGLVQDLNGNHVIQKCLNKLGAEKSQFIYDAVGMNCVTVGTHRHGCCVLQRCIDHAKSFQRAQLIARITKCAFDLVQDPFGNYVVQYILDLDELQFTKPICESFLGKIAPLSKQKFSSNVIEKCIRTADHDTKRRMVAEMLLGNELEKMLRDSFANYVVQTALEYSEPDLKARIIDAIRPILPAIKQTPHGRRIASKIMGLEGNYRPSGSSSAPMTPPEGFAGGFGSGRAGSGRRQVQIVGGGFNTPRYANNFSDDSTAPIYGNNNFATSIGMSGDLADHGNMYGAQNGPPGPQNPYAAYGGSAVGNNYI